MASVMMELEKSTVALYVYLRDTESRMSRRDSCSASCQDGVFLYRRVGDHQPEGNARPKMVPQ